MNAQELLTEISDYRRQTGLAELTFGRRAVNDGKLAARLRNGGRITTERSTASAPHGQQPNPSAISRPAVIERMRDMTRDTPAMPPNGSRRRWPKQNPR